MDGTKDTLPDTPKNQADYPHQSIQKPGQGFPISRWVGLLCGATGAVLDEAIGQCSNKNGSEHASFRELLGSIAVGDLILADRDYCAYFVIALLQRQGGDVLLQQHQRYLANI